MTGRPFTCYEFFAGGGMAAIGLGDGWRPVFANDFDPGKAQAYRANLGGSHLAVGDVWALELADLPGRADLAWASSPCQDLSLAGARAGLDGRRSSAFWGFWRLIQGLAAEGRAPRTLVVENVVGLLTSARGADFAALCEALAGLGYRFGALEIDASLWLPQSRPRVFVVASLEPCADGAGPSAPFHSPAVVAAHARLPKALQAAWVWWALRPPPARNRTLDAVLQPDAEVPWFAPEAVERLLSLMAEPHRRKVEAARAAGERRVGALYRRVRREGGEKVQRAEVRFDGLAGCLRTPAGGSSRQIVVVVEGGAVKARRLSPREAARLMGLPDDYRLPPGQTRALKLLGDGVAAPVVRALAAEILEPLLRGEAAAAA